jgi:glycosyltransferase involved in cell wall biosynthesis
VQHTNSNPLVSFLVPCFNYARYLTECIQSIQKQTFQNFEILILDDASSDETAQLATELTQADARISYFRHEKNIGHLNNYNFGLERAKGALVWLISADDALADADILECFVSTFEQHPKLGFAFCRVQCMDEHSQPYQKFIPNPQGVSLPLQPTVFKGRELFRQLIKANFVPAPSTIARKACYSQYGFFHPQLTHSGDWYNWLLFCLDWDVWFEPEAKVYYRKHQQNMHLTYEKPQHALENTLLCYQELEAFLKIHHYPQILIQQCEWARLQFMHKNGFALNLGQKLTRLSGKLWLQ